MGRTVKIELPYEDDLELELTDVKTSSNRDNIPQMLEWMRDTQGGADSEEELRAIFTCTAALIQEHPEASVRDCFYQSLVWLRG